MNSTQIVISIPVKQNSMRTDQAFSSPPDKCNLLLLQQHLILAVTDQLSGRYILLWPPKCRLGCMYLTFWPEMQNVKSLHQFLISIMTRKLGFLLTIMPFQFTHNLGSSRVPSPTPSRSPFNFLANRCKILAKSLANRHKDLGIVRTSNRNV